MLIRTVRMTFRPEALPEFMALFEATAPQIRASAGCRHLELWEDARFANILSTFSIWDSAADLERYRHSELFRETWAVTRRWFAAPPLAASQTRLALVAAPDEA